MLDADPLSNHNWRKESDAWQVVYGTSAEIRRRQKAMPGKLQRLGIDRAPQDSSILDLCCGHGEALEALFAMGFRNLSGVDIVIPDTVLQDPRFAVRIRDARNPGYPDSSFDWIINIHAMHHLGTPENIEEVLTECYRMLKPGGKLGIVDFPNSPQIRLAFLFFRQNRLLWTPYLKNFGRVVQEEWHFLKLYLPQWPRVRRLLFEGQFEVVSNKSSLFYFHLVLRKPK